MESTWYLFPGQTLENTKISDRAHALHITKSGWDNVTRHLDRKKILQEATDKEAEVRRYLADGSKNMTKNWENSLENVRKRKEEERERQLEEKKEERQRKFLELRKEQEEIRAQYMEKVQKQMFLSTGPAKELTSALITSEVIFEREKQHEFNNKIKQHDKEVDEQFWKFQKQKDEEAAKADEEKRQKVAEKNKKYAIELKQIIEEQSSLKAKLREDKIKKEAMDNIEAVKEMEKLKQMQNEERQRRMKELADEKKKFLEKQRELELQKIKENKELDEVVQIYKDAKHRIDCMKKQKEKELRDIEVKRREKIASMVMAEEMGRSEAEERTLKKAIAEREEAEMQKIKARQEYDAKMKRELLKNRQDMLIKEEQKRAREEEVKKWELINRYKTDEHMMKYEEEKRKRCWQTILQYRKELCEQMEDQKLDQQREKEIEDALDRACVPEGHDQFFQYADEVLELAKKKSRNIVPIEKAINRYVKYMNIKTDKYGAHADPCQPGGISVVQKKLVKPAKPKLCRCKLPVK